MERAVRAKAERDATRHEEAMARLEIKAMSGEDSWMKAKSERDAVQQVLAAAEEAC